jgi:hypothetical protein
MLLYALSVFFGAFLLFQVQPLAGKYILPWFGGGPGVWTTCLLFFQTVLLFGYAYAHVSSTRLKPRQQAWLHLALLSFALLTLPIIPSTGWKPTGSEEPIGRILLLLTVTLGLPYFVLSATGPLLQRWFTQTNPGRSPYRLYALSNVGSLLALISYPFYFENAFTRRVQALAWSGGLVLFTLLCGLCAWRLRNTAIRGDDGNIAASGSNSDLPADPKPSLGTRTLWLVFPALASILLIATTNQVSQDVAVIPFLWVIPLALYLLSFILCFDHPRWYQRKLFAALLVVGMVVVCHLLFVESSENLGLQIVGYSGALFVACMVCHGELYRLKPSPRYLTAFYLQIAAGGALGGVLVAVVAPLLFDRYAELQIGLWALSYMMGIVCLKDKSRSLALGMVIGLVVSFWLLPALRMEWDDGIASALKLYPATIWETYRGFWKEGVLVIAVSALAFGDRWYHLARGWRPRMGGFVMFLSLGFGVCFIVQIHRATGDAVASTRNFYGTLKVYEELESREYGHHVKLVHGVITHGLQFKNPIQSMWPTTYYGETSGVGVAMKNLKQPEGARRIGLVGLGTGTLATYGRTGDYFRIYEINPDVEKIARSHFSFLEQSEAKIEVVLGDARLSMEHELARREPQNFDLLALDAFSSDAIPIHLLTREAMTLYLQHLRKDGIIAVHVSNRYLDLQPIVEKLAEEFKLSVATISDDDSDSWWIYQTKWMLLARAPETLAADDIQDNLSPLSAKTKTAPLWTDDHASLFQILR